MITTAHGKPVSRLGLAAYADQDSRCVPRAFRQGINFFFFYGPGYPSFISAVGRIVSKKPDEVIVASGSGARKPSSLLAARRKITKALGADKIDMFFAEYISQLDSPETIFGDGGVLDVLQQWKAAGSIRYVGVTTHDRTLAQRLVVDPRVDVLMHRFNMAHRKAAEEVFPDAVRRGKPIIAFTATRWGTLLKGHHDWPNPPPTAAECYRYCLAQPAVQLVLTAPRRLRELDEDLQALHAPRMNSRECRKWQRFGDIIYSQGKDRFEKQWP